MAFGAFISGAIGLISSCVSAIGGAVGGYATSLIARIPPLVLFDTTRIISMIIEAVSVWLGLGKEGETAEELGAKALAGEKKLEDFSSTEEYLEYLRNEVKLDRDKLSGMSTEERIASTAVGVAILSKGVEEKMGLVIPSDFWAEAGKLKLKADEVRVYLDSFKAGGIGELKLAEYLKGQLSVSENRQISPVMEQALRQLNPELSAEAIQEKLSDMRKTSRE